MHLINDLKINMLINNDILDSEKFIIDLEKEKTYIDSCDIIVFIKIQRRSNDFVQRSIHIKTTIIISSRSKMIVNIHYLINIISRNKDFLFELNELNLTIYTYSMNVIIEIILIRNDKD